MKNTMMADLVEDIKKTKASDSNPQAAADDSYAGSQEVACDVCLGRKRRASKSCLQCVVSYCDEHLQPHYGESPLKQHKLTEPLENLQENICSKHNKVKEIFCRTDKQCICCLCHINEHKNHSTVSTEDEMAERQRELETGRHKSSQIKERLENNVGRLQQELMAINESADNVVRENEDMARKLIGFIQQKSSDLTQKIRQQQKIGVRRAQEELRRLEQALHEQRMKSTELEQFSRTVNCVQFLQRYPSSIQTGEQSNIPALQGQSFQYFKDISKAVSETKNLLNDKCSKRFIKLSQMVTEVDVLLPQHPKTNEEFSHYSVQLTLNPNTLSMQLILSESNTKVTSVKVTQEYPPHSDRFLTKAQVLSQNPLPARCYWEVEWGGLGVTVGVAYKDIRKVGYDSGFGSNNTSWVLECSTKNLYFYKHNSTRKQLSVCQSNRVGVFLDHRASTLLFYEVSDTVRLIHKVQAKFTQPLYAGLGVYHYGAAAKMCDKK